MAIVAAAPVVLPTVGLGAPFAGAVVVVAPKRVTTVDAITKNKECFVRYRLATGTPIEGVANFYKAEGASSGAKLFDDTGNRFPDYRTLAFAEPKFMFVVLDRNHETTTINVSYKIRTNCS